MEYNSTKLTVISHIFDEEYLLPFWLEYHSQIFDHGIIIDYCSTDNSLEIIKRFCPTWEIVKTKNLNQDGTPNFQADLIYTEIAEIEKNIEGLRIVLNTSEFLFLTKNKDNLINLLSNNTYYFIKSYSVLSNKINYYPKNTVEFLNNINTILKIDRPSGSQYRILHSDKSISYHIGRYGVNNTDNKPIVIDNSNNFFILWLKFYPFNDATIRRILHIQQNIPYYDKITGLGYQDIDDSEKLKIYYHVELNNSSTDIYNICNVYHLVVKKKRRKSHFYLLFSFQLYFTIYNN